ncbi:hypothetical protein SALBM311S_01306 [Streptomyces alboniger]
MWVSPPRASGWKTATRWQFWKASATPKCRSRLARMASLDSARSSWPRSFSEGGGVWLSANSPVPERSSVARTGDEVVGVRQGGADRFHEVLLSHLAVLGFGEQLRRDVERHEDCPVLWC